MDDLVQFLRARYDEETAAARAAMDVVGPVPGAGQWKYAKGLGDAGGAYWSITTTSPNDTVPTVELIGSGMSGGGVHEEAVAQHVVRHDPARVLAEVEAKRGIVNDLAEVIRESEEYKGPDYYEGVDACERTLKRLALPYADHPDYPQKAK